METRRHRRRMREKKEERKRKKGRSKKRTIAKKRRQTLETKKIGNKEREQSNIETRKENKGRAGRE